MKRTMSFTIILVFIIFLGLIFLLSAFYLDPVQGLVLAILGSAFIILFQYAMDLSSSELPVGFTI